MFYITVQDIKKKNDESCLKYFQHYLKSTLMNQNTLPEVDDMFVTSSTQRTGERRDLQ